jgi:hypothetical protein
LSAHADDHIPSRYDDGSAAGCGEDVQAFRWKALRPHPVRLRARQGPHEQLSPARIQFNRSGKRLGGRTYFRYGRYACLANGAAETRALREKQRGDGESCEGERIPQAPVAPRRRVLPTVFAASPHAPRSSSAAFIRRLAQIRTHHALRAVF